MAFRISQRLAVGASVLAVALSVTLAGCGKSESSPSASPSPTDNGVSALAATEILSKAVAAANGQSSVNVAINGTQGGKTFKLNVNMSKAGGASGTISAGDATQQFFATESNVWVKADKQYWETAANPAAAELVGNRWVKIPATNPDASGFAFGDYAKSIEGMLKPEGTLTKGELSTLNGQPTIILVSSEGQLWIATTGQPLPQQMKSKTGTDGSDGTLVFSQWGSAQVGSAPAGSDVIDISKLQ